MNPIEETTPKPMDEAVLAKVHAQGRKRMTKSEKKAIEARKGQKTPGQRVPTFDIRAQAKGPIRPGPSSVVQCALCTRLFGRPTGTRRRHAARHLADHRAGRIRAVVAKDEK